MTTKLDHRISLAGPTPHQTSGPFYPGERNASAVTDLTVLPGHRERARGQVVYVRGQVRDVLGLTVSGATVEIWQACATGRYNHDEDPNVVVTLDPNFRYWGRSVTDEFGRYSFKTIVPGAYPAEPGWDRPPHIHFRVTKPGFEEVLTQMYFAGHPLNETDLILDKVPREEWSRLIVPFGGAGEGLEPGSLQGKFDITLIRS
jgi:protocatechuate 3,4-dioxygenase beta subunit